jgi:hypothetical protein
VKITEPKAPPAPRRVGQAVSIDAARLMGAFSEDAISEEDARDAMEDPFLSPAEALSPRSR